MRSGSRECSPLWRCCRWALVLFALTVALMYSTSVYSQTASTGALTGVTLDPSGAVLPGVTLHLTKRMVLKRSLPPRTTMADLDFSCCDLGLMRSRQARLTSNP